MFPALISHRISLASRLRKTVLRLLPGLLALAVARAQPLRREEVQVELQAAPADAALLPTVAVAAASDGAQLLDITVRNRGDRPVALGAATVRFPWIRPGGGPLLVSAGGTTMAGWPTRVVDPAQPGPPAESGTYLLARQDGRHRLVAFLSWKTFWSRLTFAGGDVIMHADGEDRILQPGETVHLEKICLAEGADWQDLLFGYAERIAQELRIRLKPRPQFSGWSTWDYFGRKFTAADVKANLAVLRQIAPGANLLQIDGGWWPQRGDFNRVRSNLGPDGMKVLADEIHAAGLTAGIHFDGARGDLSSAVLQAHPEYFLKDNEGRIINVPQANDGDRLAHTYFDFSEPGAIAYMREVARNIRRNWGYDYLKIDFLVNSLAVEIRRTALHDDPRRKIVPHNPGLTSVERLHRALGAWREGMGDDAYFLACSAPFGVVFGHADGMRTGYDIFPHFTAVRECAEATAGAFYLHGRVVYNDADYVVVRGPQDEDATLVSNPEKKSTLTDNEAEMWADYVGLFGGTKLNSDNLPVLHPGRRALFQRALALPACSRFVPLDYWAHGRRRDDAFEVMLGEAEGRVYLALFNWAGQERTYRLAGAAALPRSPLCGSASVSTTGSDRRQVAVAARHAVVFQLPEGSRFDDVRHALRTEE